MIWIFTLWDLQYDLEPNIRTVNIWYLTTDISNSVNEWLDVIVDISQICQTVIAILRDSWIVSVVVKFSNLGSESGEVRDWHKENHNISNSKEILIIPQTSRHKNSE